jgi:hypothetical protein
MMNRVAVAALTLLLPAALHARVVCGPTPPSRTIPSGESYSLDLSNAQGASEVRIDESRDPRFEGAVRTLTWRAATPEPVFMHLSMNDQHLYYRMTRFSDSDRELVPCTWLEHLTILADRKIRDHFRRSVIPVVHRSADENGAHVVTSLTLFNTHQRELLSGRIVFRAAGVAGSDDDPSVSYAIGHGGQHEIPDILKTLGVHGLGSLDIIPDDRSPDYLPATDVRILEVGADGSAYAMPVPQVRVADFAAESVVTIPVPDAEVASVSIGVRTWEGGGTLTAHIEDRKQTRDVDLEFPSTYFTQLPLDEFAGFHVTPPALVVIKAKGAVVYGIETDNRTGDRRLRIPYGDLEGEKTYVGDFFQ